MQVAALWTLHGDLIKRLGWACVVVESLAWTFYLVMLMGQEDQYVPVVAWLGPVYWVLGIVAVAKGATCEDSRNEDMTWSERNSAADCAGTAIWTGIACAVKIICDCTLLCDIKTVAKVKDGDLDEHEAEKSQELEEKERTLQEDQEQLRQFLLVEDRALP